MIGTGRAAQPDDCARKSRRVELTDAAHHARCSHDARPCDFVMAGACSLNSRLSGRVTPQRWNLMLAINLTGTDLAFRKRLAHLPGWGREGSTERMKVASAGLRPTAPFADGRKEQAIAAGEP